MSQVLDIGVRQLFQLEGTLVEVVAVCILLVVVVIVYLGFGFDLLLRQGLTMYPRLALNS